MIGFCLPNFRFSVRKAAHQANAAKPPLKAQPPLLSQKGTTAREIQTESTLSSQFGNLNDCTMALNAPVYSRLAFVGET